MVGAVYLPFLNTLLGTVPLPLENWGVIIGLSLIKLLGIEIAKWYFFQRRPMISTA